MAQKNILIRPETVEDAAAVYRVNEAAFGRPDEARLVDALRPGEEIICSLVAEGGGEIFGHALFTTVILRKEDGTERTGAALGPVAVLPTAQRQGVGSALIQAGLAELQKSGLPFCVVLGHSSYYPRFGFQPAAPQGILCQWDVPEDVFMVLALRPGGLEGCEGTIYYAEPFLHV